MEQFPHKETQFALCTSRITNLDDNYDGTSELQFPLT